MGHIRPQHEQNRLCTSPRSPLLPYATSPSPLTILPVALKHRCNPLLPLNLLRKTPHPAPLPSSLLPQPHWSYLLHYPSPHLVKCAVLHHRDFHHRVFLHTESESMGSKDKDRALHRHWNQLHLLRCVEHRRGSGHAGLTHPGSMGPTASYIQESSSLGGIRNRITVRSLTLVPFY